MPSIVIDYDRCENDGKCVEICPVNIFEITEDEELIKPKDKEVKSSESLENSEKVDFKVPNCRECLSCELSCPKDAIEIK